jgi:hypothetical protein
MRFASDNDAGIAGFQRGRDKSTQRCPRDIGSKAIGNNSRIATATPLS